MNNKPVASSLQQNLLKGLSLGRDVLLEFIHHENEDDGKQHIDPTLFQFH